MPVTAWTIGAASLLRRLTPASLRPRIRLLMFEWLRLDWDFPTGVRIHIGNYGDWVVYNEIFASGEYDAALAMAFDRAAAAGRTPHVVDLGANSGFSTLRVLHEARRRGMAVSVIAVEAHPGIADRFRARMAEQSIANETVRLLHGLAGERDGAGVLYEDTAHVSSDVHGSTHAGDPRLAIRVPYVNLSEALKDVARIDLLKCDIEGSEERVIETYADVFAKVDVAVFELHRGLCDVARCQELLRSYGFTHATTYRQGDNFTYGVWR
jgi:FkbM family methyltransferase